MQGIGASKAMLQAAAGLFSLAVALLPVRDAVAASAAWTLISTSSSNPAPPAANWSPPDQGLATQPVPALGDLNGDGKTDVILGLQDGSIVTYENTGTASVPAWTAAPTAWNTLSQPCHIVSESYYYASPALADLNGDGLPDLVIGVRDGLCVYQNTGTASAPTWTRNGAWETGLGSLPTNSFYQPSLADIDGDGRVDMMVDESGRPTALRNTGTASDPAWAAEPAWNMSTVTGINESSLVDLDGDGRIDIMISDPYGDLFAFKNTGTTASPDWQYAPAWSPIVSGGTTSGNTVIGLALGDLNGDGRPDLMYNPSINSNGAMTVYEQNPAGLPAPGFASGPPPASAGTTVTETFDSFSCGGTWLPAAGGLHSSYTRDCGNGWTAYAEDTYTNAVGYQNVVTANTGVNGPSAATGTPGGVAEMYTSPDAAQGQLWLLKTFPVLPGVPIRTLGADYRISINDTDRDHFGMVVFDGIVTNPSGLVNASTATVLNSKVIASNLPLDGPLDCGTNPCPWHSVDLGGAVPAHSYITVGFVVSDIRTTNRPLMDIDNLTVSNVVNGTPVSLPVGDVAQKWNADYQAPGTNSGGQASNPAEAKGVATDSAGNVYTVGDSNYDIATIKYDAAGKPLWSAIYDGGDADQAAALAVDASGNVYVTGRSYNSATASFDYVVVKYDSSGAQQWATTYDNLNRDDEPVGLAVDSGGDVYVTGSSCRGAADCKIATVKLGPSGTVQWHVLFDDGGMATVSTAAGIGVDGSGKIYVAGTGGGAEADTIITVKYDATGAQLRLNRYQTGSGEQAQLMTTDAAGDVFIAGVTSGTSGNLGIVVLEYGGTAVDGDAPRWVRFYNANYETLPAGLAVDTVGNVYVTGSTGDPGNHDIVTVKYLTNGDTAWAQTFDNAGGDDRAKGVAVDGSGNVYVIGSYTRNSGNTDMLLLKYDSSGVARSGIAYDGYTVNDTPAAVVLNVDGDGDPTPIVAGTSTDSTGLLHMATVQFERAFPDLTVTGISGPSGATVGDTIAVSNTVFNIDDPANKKHRDSGPFTVGLYLAPSVGGFADLIHLTPLGTRGAGSLAPGEYGTDNTSVAIPADVAEGDYFLVALADSTGAVTERDETNNYGSVTWPISIAGTKPDLVVSNISGPASAARGATVSVSTTVTNAVSTPATASFRVGIYLSSDATVTTGDTLLGSYTLTGLAAFTSSTAATDVTIPANLAAGNYYLGAIVDDQGAVAEADETNNTALVTAGTASSTLLVSTADFLAGLPGIGVGVNTSDGTADVRLAYSAVWSRTPAWDMPDIGAYAGVGIGDVNGDGLPDLMAGDYLGNLYAYKNSGSPSAPLWTAAPAGWTSLSADCTAGGYNTYKEARLVDLDGDGLLDLVMGTRGGVCFYQNTGTKYAPVWTLNSAWLTGLSLTANRFYVPAPADLDGDGKVDLVLGWSGGFLAFKNTGTVDAPSWTEETAWEDAGIPSSQNTPALVDLNGDGKFDLLLGDSAGTLTAYQNTGSVEAPAWTRNSAWDIADPDASTSNEAVPAAADLNRDGKPDLLYGDIGGSAFAYENTGTYASSGTYLSKVVDAGTHGGFTTLSYTAVTPQGTTLSVDVRAGDSIQGAITANPGTGADGSFNSGTYDGTSIPGITGTSPSLTINTDNAPQIISSGDSVYPNGAGVYNFTDFTLASGDTITVTGGKALVIRTNTGNVTIAGTLDASGTANGAGGPGGYGGGYATANGSGPGGGTTTQYLAGGGGGYGGSGGASGDAQAGGPAYGSADISVFYGGSGGGGCDDTGSSQYGGGGGGAVKIESAGDIHVPGSVRANGSAGGTCTASNGNTNAYDASGGGAGGAVYLSADHVTVGGTIQVAGGKGGDTPYRSSGGGGGGGRIYLRGATSVDVTGTVDEGGGAAGSSPNYPGSPGGDGSYLVPQVTPVFATEPGGTWTQWVNAVANGGDISALGTKRYVQYRIQFTTSDDTVSPALYNIQANAQPAPPAPLAVSVALGDGSGGGGLDAWSVLVLALLALSRGGYRTAALRCRR